MKKYVIVGVGGRALMFIEALMEKYNDTAKIVAICDCNEGRLQLASRNIKTVFPDMQCYSSFEFDRMISVHLPDVVIVTTNDCYHDDYICRSLESGCDVISEKPITIDEKKCQRIVDTIKKTGRSVRVTFNYRYSPPRSQIKELIDQGVVGKILSVNLSWSLDTNHGVDYFRRWHSNKANSGGLLVHKATHHFDLINWWLRSEPETVFAKGARLFYNVEQAKRYGLENHGSRCLDCDFADKCNYYLNIKNIETMKELYFDNEQYDGYVRDKCPFRDDIDIEDTMSVVAQYRSGAILTYSLNAYMPWEGYKLEINGTKGRLEQLCRETTYVSGDGTPQGESIEEGTGLTIFPHFKTPYKIPVWQGDGAHGGGDIRMLEDIFGKPEYDPLERAADYVQGIRSALVGIAANKSMATDKMVYLDELVGGLSLKVQENQFKNEFIPYVSDACLFSGGEKIIANTPHKVYDKSQSRK